MDCSIIFCYIFLLLSNIFMFFIYITWMIGLKLVRTKVSLLRVKQFLLLLMNRRSAGLTELDSGIKLWSIVLSHVTRSKRRSHRLEKCLLHVICSQLFSNIVLWLQQTPVIYIKVFLTFVTVLVYLCNVWEVIDVMNLLTLVIALILQAHIGA